MTKKKGDDVDDDLTRYIETGDLIDVKPRRGNGIDAVVQDPQLVSVADASDGSETTPGGRIADAREIIAWLANRYPGLTGATLVLAMARDISRMNETIIAAREFFEHRPAIAPQSRFRERAELAQRLKWLLGI